MTDEFPFQVVQPLVLGRVTTKTSLELLFVSSTTVSGMLNMTPF